MNGLPFEFHAGFEWSTFVFIPTIALTVDDGYWELGIAWLTGFALVCGWSE